LSSGPENPSPQADSDLLHPGSRFVVIVPTERFGLLQDVDIWEIVHQLLDEGRIDLRVKGVGWQLTEIGQQVFCDVAHGALSFLAGVLVSEEPDRLAEESIGELHGEIRSVRGSPDRDVLCPAIGNDAKIRLSQ
jgi:hypothetical protein